MKEYRTVKEHLYGTAELAGFFAERFGKKEWGYCCGMLHDLGKVRLNFYMNEKVEDEILAVDETRYMRMHPSIGYAILADYDYNQTVLDAVLYHHEHYDGTGYPHNLVGKQIPLVGRIMMYVIFSEQLISNRDYREGFDC